MMTALEYRTSYIVSASDTLNSVSHHTILYYTIQYNQLGKGLFAKRRFRKGEIVTVSPVILIPKDRVIDSSKTACVLINYCIASAHSSIALFPFALGALINHGPPQTANVEVDWYWWNEDGANDETMIRKMNTPLIDLSQEGSAQLDLQYIATRDIEAGEEIHYSYGQEWQDAWSRYSEEISQWTENDFKRAEVRDLRAASTTESLEMRYDGDIDNSAPMPRFRYFIDGLDHLFLPSWRDNDQSDENLSSKINDNL